MRGVTKHWTLLNLALAVIVALAGLSFHASVHHGLRAAARPSLAAANLVRPSHRSVTSRCRFAPAAEDEDARPSEDDSAGLAALPEAASHAATATNVALRQRPSPRAWTLVERGVLLRI